MIHIIASFEWKLDTQCCTHSNCDLTSVFLYRYYIKPHSFFFSEMITISSEIGSKPVMNFLQSDRMVEVDHKIFLALSMDDIVRRWYQNGLFYSEPEFRG